MVNEHKVDQPKKEEIASSCLVETRLTRVPNKAIPYQNKTTHLDPIMCLEGTGPSAPAGRGAGADQNRRPPAGPGTKQTKNKGTLDTDFVV